MEPELRPQAGASAPLPRLRAFDGGYDLRRWPLNVAPRPGEYPAAALGRIADPYRVTVKELLRSLGAVSGWGSPAALHSWLLGAEDELRIRLGDEAADTLLAAEPPTAAWQSYMRLYRPGYKWAAPVGVRYCPECLAAPSPTWQADWAFPAAYVCPIHELILQEACPACGQRPYSSGAWLARPAKPGRCPERTAGTGLGHGIPHPGCPGILAGAPHIPAPPGASAAQAHLLELAARAQSDPGAQVQACGIQVTAQVALDAFLELAADTGTPGSALEAAEQLAAANRVLAAGRQEAADLASSVGLLQPHGIAAPAGGDETALLARPHSPVLAAVALTARHPGAEIAPPIRLAYRFGSQAPRYPIPVTVPPAQRDRLVLPALAPKLHRPRTPPRADLGAERIPQALWPGSPRPPFDGPHQRALASLILAKYGDPRTWRRLRVELGLPSEVGLSLSKLWPQLKSQGQLDETLAWAEKFHAQLEQKPPTVDYQVRRVIGDDTRLIVRAIDAAIAALKLTADRSFRADAARLFWEKFTGGDIRYAPARFQLRGGAAAHDVWLDFAARYDGVLGIVVQTAFEAVCAASPLKVSGAFIWQPP